MVTHKSRPARSGGYSLIHAMIGVVVLGIGATVAIPRAWAARAEAMDEEAVAELTRATSLARRYQQMNGSLPGTPSEAAFAVGPNMVITRWKRQTVGGVESVHIDLRHRASSHSFHTDFPLEGNITMLPLER